MAVPVLTESIPDALAASDLNVRNSFACDESWLRGGSFPGPIMSVLVTLPNGTILGTSNVTPGNSVLLSSVAGSISGLGAASLALGRAHGSNLTFPINLGKGLALMDWAESPGACSPVLTCITAELDQQLGFAFPLIRGFASIAYVVPHGEYSNESLVQAIGISYPEQFTGPARIQLEVMGANSMTNLTLNGVTYSYIAPSNGAVACPVNVTAQPDSMC
jgi:hypothetical protein